MVVDTNVLVSGLLTPWGPSGEIIRMIASGTLCPLHDARMFTEYQSVLARNGFPFRKKDVDDLLAQILSSGAPVASEPLPHPLTDPDDEAFLEVALSGGAAVLITGNARHFPKERSRNVKILSPSEFLTYFRHNTKEN